jgi:hypothetical protein
MMFSVASQSPGNDGGVMSISKWLCLIVSVVLTGLLCNSVEASVGKRVALVIGNSAYKHAGELANPRNDAADLVAALKARGFHTIEGRDLKTMACIEEHARPCALQRNCEIEEFLIQAGLVGGQTTSYPSMRN